jgi:hypothetical protein
MNTGGEERKMDKEDKELLTVLGSIAMIGGFFLIFLLIGKSCVTEEKCYLACGDKASIKCIEKCKE